MKRTIYVILAVALLAIPAFMQQSAAGGLNILDIKKKVESSNQKKNVLVTFDPAANRSTITTTRIILGTQTVVQDNGDGPQSFGSSIPSWEVFVHTAFEGQVLGKSADEFAWKFNIYNPRAPQDAELIIKVDGEDLTFKPARSGRSAVSNLGKPETGPQLDKTQEMISQNTGNLADSSKPIYEIFVLKRSDLDKIVHGTKVKIGLGKQLDVKLIKELKMALDLMLNVTAVP